MIQDFAEDSVPCTDCSEFKLAQLLPLSFQYVWALPGERLTLLCCMMVLLGEHLIPHSGGGYVLTSSDTWAVPPDDIFDIDLGEASEDPLCGLWSRTVNSPVLLSTMDATYQLMAVQSQNWARKVHTLKGNSLHCLTCLTCLQVNACCLNCVEVKRQWICL